MAHTIEDRDGIQVLRTDDLFNPLNNNEIVKDVEKCIAEGKSEFIIDLSDMPYMSSSGLSFLVSILTRARSAGGEVVISNVSPKIQQIFLVTRLNSAFTVKDNLDDALEFFQKVKA